jgi:hypothetical protein
MKKLWWELLKFKYNQDKSERIRTKTFAVAGSHETDWKFAHSPFRELPCEVIKNMFLKKNQGFTPSLVRFFDSPLDLTHLHPAAGPGV